MEDGASDVESEFESESAISLAKWWTVLGFPDRERLEQTLKCTTQRHMLQKAITTERSSCPAYAAGYGAQAPTLLCGE